MFVKYFPVNQEIILIIINSTCFTWVALPANLDISWSTWTYIMITNIGKCCSFALPIVLTCATNGYPFWLNRKLIHQYIKTSFFFSTFTSIKFISENKISFFGKTEFWEYFSWSFFVLPLYAPKKLAEICLIYRRFEN